MAHEGFQVDLEALSAARDRVGRLADELGRLPDRDVPVAKSFGHTGLADAVEEFADREKRGQDQAAGETESIRRRLAETIDAYREADDTGARRFRGIGS